MQKLPIANMDNLDVNQGDRKGEISCSSERDARIQTPSCGEFLTDDTLRSQQGQADTTSADLSSSDDGDDDIALFGQNFLTLDEVNDFSPDDVDSLLAHELTQLSIADREKLYYDIHGVSSEVVEETPELLEQSLHLFQKELDGMDDHAIACKKALELNSAYVQNIKLRLRFLRAERFDAKKAAVRFVKFFQVKLDLFGPDLLVKEITQEDLEEDALKALYEGLGMVLPFRDRAGRLVSFQLAQPETLPIKAVLQKSFYACMVHSEDEETQKNGMVVISYIVGQVLTWQQIAKRQQLNREWGKLVPGLPIRVEAMHLCTDSILWRSMFAVFKVAAGMFTRMRVREHIGNHKEVQASLKSFGIPFVDFPVSEDGEISPPLRYGHWKKRRALLEKILKQSEMQKQEHGKCQEAQPLRVGTPSHNDVLLGRGKLFYAHVGNVRLRKIVIERKALYDGAGFAGKQQVSMEIVDLVKSQGGKFLKDDGVGWVEVDDETAMRKVGHAFRTFRAAKRRKKDDDDVPT